MEDNDYVLAFDHFYTNNHIQILKSMLPFINSPTSTNLPILIKYLELKHTLALCNTNSNPLGNVISACSKSDYDNNTNENLENIYNAIHKYLSPDEEKSFSQILSAFRTMKNVREMQEMMELIKTVSPDMDFGSMMENMNFDNINFSGNDNPLNFNNMNIGDLLQLFTK